MTERKRVLIVEDDEHVRRALQRCLVRENCEVFEARDGQEGVERLERLAVDLVVTDLMMPRADGHAVLAAGVKHGVPVVVLTAHGTVETSVQMMRSGAANFLVKPFSPEHIRELLEDTFGRKPKPAEALPHHPRHRRDTPLVIGEDPRFLEAYEILQAVADTEATVLLLGESGTGKEVAARMIHQLSPRAKAPFVAVNCGAVPDGLIESELFGHKKGAFTDATQSRAGRFQLADGGTIFLDEIGDMPQQVQGKLLRVLQERVIEPLGDTQSRPVDVRVIAATHRDLQGMVEEGKFRLDLYFRLNVVPVPLPPLRERRGDIPLLVQQFLNVANERHHRNVSGVSSEVLAALDALPWPGNIRELANVVERMVVLKRAGGELGFRDLPQEYQTQAAPRAAALGAQHLPKDGLVLTKVLSDLEVSLIQEALERTHGNKNAAAALLGINRTTLVEKVKRWTRSQGAADSPDPATEPEGDG